LVDPLSYFPGASHFKLPMQPSLSNLGKVLSRNSIGHCRILQQKKPFYRKIHVPRSACVHWRKRKVLAVKEAGKRLSRHFFCYVHGKTELIVDSIKGIAFPE
jgi:hypothetical protein